MARCNPETYVVAWTAHGHRQKSTEYRNLEDAQRFKNWVLSQRGKAARPEIHKIVRNPRSHNGRSYVLRGEIPKRYWEPSQGDVVYIEGARTKLGRPYQELGDNDIMFPLRPAVRGTTDMSARNIKAIARVETVANPRSRFRVGDAVSVPWFGKRLHGRVVQIKAGGRMIIDAPSSGRHDVPTKFARDMTGQKYKVVRVKVQNPGPSAIPTHWTKATVYRAGKKVMARIGGR